MASRTRHIKPVLTGGLLLSVMAADGLQPALAPERAPPAAFAQAAAGAWREAFSDSGTADWKERWFLDGEAGTVRNGPDGMEVTAGPDFKNDAHHIVLWTKESFAGDLKIEYDYTRLDRATNCVTILYIQATGSGEGPYLKDIAAWSGLRRVPAMSTYFDNMNAYHISYAAFQNSGTASYIRGRRYMPGRTGLKGSDLEPDYTVDGLFATGVKHHITVIKTDRELLMRVESPASVSYCPMRNAALPGITEGRIGLRHMFTRSARYGNFRISTPAPPAGRNQESGGLADPGRLVAETRATSLKLREEALRRTVAKDTCWPGGTWGDNLWTLSALYLNEKTDAANARLLKQATDHIERVRKHGNTPAPTPEQPGKAPWTFFSITDYVRTLCLFHARSPHFPGRLKPETEAAMKEALWLWVSAECRLADAGPDDLFLLLGTENHDLNKRPNYYLVTALLKEDPAYSGRTLADGHTVAEHADAYAAFFREWPRSRARAGLWAEVGSNTYQKYSWPALFNLHELAPDPVVRHRFGLLLDLAFIEEAQLSVQGRRGGGRSRADYGPNAFESYKNLLFAAAGKPAGSSHSRVIETSRYQLPAEAVLLGRRAFPAEPFVIRNRVLGESEPPRPEDGGGQRLSADSALVNYAYRTPAYLLGSTLQNPALAAPDPKTGEPVLNYAGISRQKRCCGLLFDNPARATISEIYPAVEHVGGGRAQHSFWSVQHENVLLLQRIARHGRSTLGSYNTGALGMRFEGDDLEKVENDGWIFAGNGKAFAGVKFLDGGYRWDEKRTEASPARFAGPGDTTRILLHAGDVAGYGSFARFREAVLANRLEVAADLVTYRFNAGLQLIEMHRYDSSAPETFKLPRINGTAVELRPTNTYESPCLNGAFGSDRISVTVGPLARTLDFSEQDL